MEEEMSNDPSGEGVVTAGVKSAIESEPAGRRVETGRGEKGGEMVVGSVACQAAEDGGRVRRWWDGEGEMWCQGREEESLGCS